MKKITVALMISIWFLAGCGGGGGGGSSSGVSTSSSTSSGSDTASSQGFSNTVVYGSYTPPAPGASSSPQVGVFVDAPVAGLEYSTAPTGHSGTTNINGEFIYDTGDTVTFKIGKLILGAASGGAQVTPLNIVGTNDVNNAKVVSILRTLQSIDQDGNPNNGIQISNSKRDELKNISGHHIKNDNAYSDDDEFEEKTGIRLKVSEHDAKQHFEEYKNKTTGSYTDPNMALGTHTLIAWNDLGMHCVDGSDYSVFSILPPFNNLKAQLVSRSGAALVSSGVTITYEATTDESGSLNSTSSGKTNFWTYATKLYGWLLKTVNTLLVNLGLVTENPAPSTTPALMTYTPSVGLWEADGIPVTPYDDAMLKNYYPMVKVVAKNTSGTVIASTRVPLPVSDEMSCANCHASTVASTAAKPAAGWVNDATSVTKDWKKNILRLHDEKIPTAVSANSAALIAKGYNYQNKLEDTANAGTPVLCASCHSSNALPGSGVAGVKPLTQALHTKHASTIDVSTGQTLGSSTNRDSCYQCHPGSSTKCLRGAMGAAKNSDGTMKMDCQSCHGGMTTVGSSSREGWLDQPTCQNCHDKDGSGVFQRYTSVFSSGTTLRTTVDTKFATNANTPANGKSLYRFSKGHSNVSCEACHGSTHAEYPSSHANDNAQSIALQGHSGTIAECSTCHSSVPQTMTGGPHGMHATGQNAVSLHKSYVKTNGYQSCTVCHGADLKGTFLSATSQARTLSVENGQKTFTAKQQIGCYDCHNGPNP